MIKIKNEELMKELIGEVKDYPKYTTQLINLANQDAQGTRPRVVGQLSELIQECPKKTYEGWKEWYLVKHPDAIENATQKIEGMVDNFKNAINLIDNSLIKRWVKNLVLEKTFVGLKFQEAVLKKIASIKNVLYRLAEPAEESQGIDGFVGNIPVSIKPTTYQIKNALPEEIKTKIIFYKKTKSGLEVEADEILNS